MLATVSRFVKSIETVWEIEIAVCIQEKRISINFFITNKYTSSFDIYKTISYLAEVAYQL